MTKTSQRIVCIHGESALEKHAARQFAAYGEAITQGKISVSGKEGPAKGGAQVVSVGRTALLERLSRSGYFLMPDDLGEEGFVIRSVREGDQRYLILAGNTPKSTLYAVYGYLERVCKAGFFGDGENIPRLDSLPTDGLDIVEKPRFPIREYMMDCEYTSYWWGWDEWKQEVDWSAKRRFNLLSSNFDFTSTWRKVWNDFGVTVPPSQLTPPPFHPWGGWHQWDLRPGYPEDFQNYIGELCKTFTDYGRSLGIKMAPDYRGYLGQIPRAFYESYKDKTKTFDVSWAGFFDPPGKFIHPTDPMYSQLWSAYLKEYIDRFGTDHYYAGHTFSEMVPGDTPEEREIVKIENAKRALETIRSVDPKAVIFSSSWTWMDKKLWPKESVKDYLDIFPQDALLIWEQWDDRRDDAVPMYKELDYYYGKNWLLGFLHSFGGNTTVHGNLSGLIRSVQEVAHDPKADKCLGVAFQTEAMRHNYIFFDLLSRLAWNPEGIELHSYLEDYAARRYGIGSADVMTQCLKELAESVYSTADVTCPLYQLHPTRNNIEWIRGKPSAQDTTKRQKYLAHLRTALKIALSESKTLGGSPLYQHDVIDMSRQYVGDLFNVHAIRMFDAFNAGDSAAFEKEVAACERLLQSQETLLSSSDWFSLQPILDKAKSLPHAPEDFDERIRDILTIWAGKIPDYARRDYYELVRFYYHPRFGILTDYLRTRLSQGATDINESDFRTIFQPLEESWVKKGFSVSESDRFPGTPAEAARYVLRRHMLESEL